MKIISIVIDNTKVVKLFHIKLDGKNLHVAGGVSEGKTTAISALWDILERKGDSITRGEKKGCVRIVLGGDGKRIIAERLTVPSGSTLRITDQDGGKITAQDFKGMISALSVNPHRIMDMKGAEQVKTLLSAASVDIDLEAADQKIESLESDRLLAHKTAEAIKPGEAPKKVKKVSVTDLIKRRDEAEATNRGNRIDRASLESLKADREGVTADVDALKDDIEDAKAQLKKKLSKVSSLDVEVRSGEKALAKMKDVDTSKIDKEIAASTETNEKATEYANWAERDAKHATAQGQYRKLDTAVKENKNKRAAALDTAKWPLKGLEVREGKVLYKGNLLTNLGESEQMLVCCALAIKDIKAHPMKVVRIDGAESMSPEHIKDMVKMFNDEDIQVLSTRVSRGEIEPEEITIVEGKYTDEEGDNGE